MTKWAERFVAVVEGGRLVHIVLTALGYAIMSLLVLGWLVQCFY